MEVFHYQGQALLTILDKLSDGQLITHNVHIDISTATGQNGAHANGCHLRHSLLVSRLEDT
jgi:hypothetical protein